MAERIRAPTERNREPRKKRGRGGGRETNAGRHLLLPARRSRELDDDAVVPPLRRTQLAARHFRRSSSLSLGLSSFSRSATLCAQGAPKKKKGEKKPEIQQTKKIEKCTRRPSAVDLRSRAALSVSRVRLISEGRGRVRAGGGFRRRTRGGLVWTSREPTNCFGNSELASGDFNGFSLGARVEGRGLNEARSRPSVLIPIPRVSSGPSPRPRRRFCASPGCCSG